MRKKRDWVKWEGVIKMAKIENWHVYPEKVKIPIISCNLYEAYGLSIPNLGIMDEKARKRYGPYFPEESFKFNFKTIQENYIIMYLSINPKLKEGKSFEYSFVWSALDIAAEESTGTWDPDLKTITPEEMDKDTKENMKILQAKIIGVNFRNGMAAIGLPKQGFEYGNLPQLLSVVEGNYNGMTSAVYGVRLEDLDFPDDYADSFIGPTLGNEGIKKIVGNGITVGTIVKPKTGLSVADWAKTARRSFEAGLAVVKDDENLTDQEYCKFDDRARAVLSDIKEIEKKTGRKLVYVPNITTGNLDEMLRRADLIKNLDGNCLMIDILAAGFSAVQTIRKKYPNMILHGHRAGHGDRTIFPEIIIDGKKIELRHGISMRALALFARLAGIDQFHIGAPKGKMEASSQTVLENLEACRRPLGTLSKIKPIRPICSGGLKATVMWDVSRIMNPEGEEFNQDIIFQAGGGTHAHDLGTIGGAKSMVQARDAIKNGKTPQEIIGEYFETLLAFRKWDNNIYGDWLKNLKKDSKIVVEPDLRPYYAAGIEIGNKPDAVDLHSAIIKFPELKTDLEKWNPELLKEL
ncbi:MAG: RuBisCO large subunit C-terminal-like domain-containing protein [Promethearchaeota archaeon]